MYRKRKTAWALFAIVLVLSVLGSTLAACAPAPAAPTAAPQPTAAQPAPTTPPVAPPQATAAAKPAAATPAAQAPATAPTSAPAGAKLAKDQVLRLPWTEPPSMDPGLATDNVSIDILANVFEGLVEFDETGNPKPMMAEKWDISTDGKTYTFTIRKGPKWTNGDPVTAKDFEYAWKRNLDPATASEYAGSLYPIKGAQDFNQKKTNDPNTVGVTAKDDQTLVVTLEEPAGYFLRLAATWTAFPLPRKALEQHKEKWTEAGNMVSNGPFKLESWKHDQEMVLVRNNDYWGTKPTLEKVVFKLFAETDQTLSQELAAYENGEVDESPMPPADVDRIMADAKLGKEILYSEMSGTFFIVPNSSKKPFDDPRVRRALALVIDPTKVIEITKQTAKPADSILPAGIVGRKPEAYDKRPDVAKAKQLLSEAGFPDGQGFPELTYNYNTSGLHKTVAEYIQDVWTKQLGLKVKLNNMEWNVFLKFRGEEKTYDINRGGWISDYEDPNNWFNMLLDSAQSNEVFAPYWKNDQFDKLVRQARGEPDAAKRKSLYEQADEILGKEMPFIPLYYYGSQRLVKPYVDGYKPTRILDIVYFKSVRILEK